MDDDGHWGIDKDTAIRVLMGLGLGAAGGGIRAAARVSPVARAEAGIGRAVELQKAMRNAPKPHDFKAIDDFIYNNIEKHPEWSNSPFPQANYGRNIGIGAGVGGATGAYLDKHTPTGKENDWGGFDLSPLARWEYERR